MFEDRDGVEFGGSGYFAPDISEPGLLKGTESLRLADRSRRSSLVTTRWLDANTDSLY